MLCPCVHIAVSHLQYLGENYERADFSQKAFSLQVPCAKRNFGMFSFLQYMFATCFGFFVAKSMCFLVSVFETDWRSLICLVALSWWEHRLLSQLNVQLSFFFAKRCSPVVSGKPKWMKNILSTGALVWQCGILYHFTSWFFKHKY